MKVCVATLRIPSTIQIGDDAEDTMNPLANLEEELSTEGFERGVEFEANYNVEPNELRCYDWRCSRIATRWLEELLVEDATDDDLIYRDEMVNELVRMSAQAECDEELFDKVHEAIRDSIDISNLRRMAKLNGADAAMGT
jgi:hypothetical protein